MTSIEQKTPDTTHNVAPFITKRWSARAFADQAISEETMATLFEATSWSASSMNEQPWKFLYAYKGSEAFDRMAACLMDGNRVWAQNAPVMVLSLARKTFDRNGATNRHAMHDLGAANTTLLLQAAELDIYGHMMGGFFMDKAVEAFEVDTEAWEIGCFIALGYLDDAETLEEPFKSRELAPRTRKSISEFTQKL